MVAFLVGKENAEASSLRNPDERIQASCDDRTALRASRFETIRCMAVKAYILAILGVLVLRGIDIAMHG